MVNDLLNDVVEELSALALASQVSLSYQSKLPQIVQVVGETEKLYRLLFNL